MWRLTKLAPSIEISRSGQVISASLNYEEIFGPRSIYESAQQKEKVLSLSYDDILRLPTNSDLLSAKGKYGMDSIVTEQD